MPSIRTRRGLLTGLSVLILLAGVLVFSWAIYQGAAPVPLQVQDADRERYQRPADVLKALDISPGDWLADVGAGNGYYARHMADLVGPSGKVFAEDIADQAIDSLRQRVKMFNLQNVEIVKGTYDNPKLPARSLTGVLVVNAYHHFTEYQLMLAHILGALKPGGRLVIADYSLPAHRDKSRADQLEIHEIDPKIARSEVEHAGFTVLRCEDAFVKRMTDAKTGYRIAEADMWLMVAIRPPSPPAL